MKSDVGLGDCDVVAEIAVDNDVAVVVVAGEGKLTTCSPNHSVMPKETLVVIGVTNLFRFDDDPEN